MKGVVTKKDVQDEACIPSARQFEVCEVGRRQETAKSRRKVFSQQHQVWLGEQNICFERNGLWCDDLRVW
jgi:hypothetical protein